jgi:hypothetical protein
MDITAKLSQIEEAWACGLHTPEDLAALKALRLEATQGYDRHRAVCLIELIESPHALRNDGEIKRLLRHRNARIWMSRLTPLPKGC